MRRGIVRDSVWSHVAKSGDVAIEDTDTGRLEIVPCDTHLAVDKYNGKEVYWEVDQAGTLTRVELVKDS